MNTPERQKPKNRKDPVHPVKYLEVKVYYTYLLQSDKDDGFYIGFTKDLKLKFEQHNKGHVNSTKDRGPSKLIYYEACLDQNDATKREKYLKSYHACPVEPQGTLLNVFSLFNGPV